MGWPDPHFLFNPLSPYLGLGLTEIVRCDCLVCRRPTDSRFSHMRTFRLEIIDRDVAWGSHYVECELVGEEGDRNLPSFRVLGIFAT